MTYRNYLSNIFFVCIAMILAPLYAETQMSPVATKKTAAHPGAVLFGDVAQSSPFSEQDYDQLILKMYVSSANVPSYWFEKGAWQLKEDNCWVSGGEDEIVSPFQFNMIKQVHYYRYKNMHPLDPSYYTQDANTVNFLQRFCFYLRLICIQGFFFLMQCLLGLIRFWGIVFRAIGQRLKAILM